MSSSDLRISVTSARKESRSRTRASNRSFDWSASGADGSGSLLSCFWASPLVVVAAVAFVDSPLESASTSSASSFVSLSSAGAPSIESGDAFCSSQVSAGPSSESMVQFLFLPMKTTYIRFHGLGGSIIRLFFRNFSRVSIFCIAVSFIFCFCGILVLLVLLRFRACVGVLVSNASLERRLCTMSRLSYLRAFSVVFVFYSCLIAEFGREGWV